MATHERAAEAEATAAGDAAAAALCGRVRRGDGRAFEELFERWFDRGVRQAAALSGRDEAFCMDAAQDAFVRVMKGLPALQTLAALDAWMSKAVRHAVIDGVRSEASRRQREAGWEAGRDVVGHSDEAGVGRLRAEIEEMEASIAKLDERDRELLRQRFGWGLALEPLGRLWGLTADATHGRIRRAVEALRASQGKRGERE